MLITTIIVIIISIIVLRSQYHIRLYERQQTRPDPSDAMFVVDDPIITWSIIEEKIKQKKKIKRKIMLYAIL